MGLFKAPISKSQSRNNTFGERIIKELTFSNDTGTVDILTVTGDVIVRIIPICKTNLASIAGANIEMGISADTNGIIASTLATDIDANEIWHDATPDSSIEALSTMLEFTITNGDDVILTLDAQVDSGKIDFTCWWVPVSTDGNVVVS